MKRTTPLLLLLAGLAAVLAATAVLSSKNRGPSGTDRPPDPAAQVRPTAPAAVSASAASAGPAAAPEPPPPAVRPETAAARTSPRTDPLLRSLEPALRFDGRVRDLLSLPPGSQLAEGRSLLASRTAEDRALGGVVLFLGHALEGDAFRAVAEDADPTVPLTVFDWIRDFGADAEIADFADALDAREFSDGDLVSFLARSASLPGGGRSALGLLLARHDEETVADALEPVLAAPGVAHDVLEQALFKILEPENKSAGLEWLEAAAGRLPEGDASLRAQSLAKWTEMAHLSDPDDEDVPYKVWDTPLRELAFLADSDLGLSVRTLANYLEYGLRRDDPDFEPVVEEGSWETANAFLERARAAQASLAPEEADALDRLAANLDRIKAYDPAFAPEEDEDAPPSAIGDDEEVPVELLNAEDAYFATFMEDDEDEDEEEEDDEDEEDADLDEDADDEDEDEDLDEEDEEEEDLDDEDDEDDDEDDEDLDEDEGEDDEDDEDLDEDEGEDDEDLDEDEEEEDDEEDLDEDDEEEDLEEETEDVESDTDEDRADTVLSTTRPDFRHDPRHPGDPRNRDHRIRDARP